MPQYTASQYVAIKATSIKVHQKVKHDAKEKSIGDKYKILIQCDFNLIYFSKCYPYRVIKVQTILM